MNDSIPTNDKERIVSLFKTFSRSEIDRFLRMMDKRFNDFQPVGEQDTDYQLIVSLANKFIDYFNDSLLHFKDPNLKKVSGDFSRDIGKFRRIILKDMGGAKVTQEEYEKCRTDILESHKVLTKFAKDFLDAEPQQDNKEQMVGQTKQHKTEDEVESKNERPYCEIKNGFGYLRFNKFGEKIKISRSDSIPFRLLQSLIEPLATAKSIPTVFEAVREKVQAKSKVGAYTPTPDKRSMLKVIEISGIKELQKKNKLRGKLHFKFDDTKAKIWLEFTG